MTSIHIPSMEVADVSSPSAQSEAAPIFVQFSQSGFFRDARAPALPLPEEVRSLNEASGDLRARYDDHPTPLIIRSLGLVVKYGTEVTAAELEAQRFVHEQLQGQVPVPEVFAWAEDAGQGFIYMDLIEGDTLQSRFKNMDLTERDDVCAELRSMVNAWRGLTQDDPEPYVGGHKKLPLHDYYVAQKPERVGPYLGADAVREFHAACRIDIEENVPLYFTQSDLCPPNILISRGNNPKVVGILDFGQAGWLPSYWEYAKTTRSGILEEDFNEELQEEWREVYLPKIHEFVPSDELFDPWVLFYLRNI
ncbi:hypothetical protein FPOA_03864 [Fusarium poae]|uniref:Aminoglycoside phosphotransferase domain-containing protein n=1 Tax=Fusarium poae TaxID=36050 RepID=A0A1B8AS10_FUSPO|nr:hypothetical protein FPOA_03864 [Fusarium poae]